MGYRAWDHQRHDHQTHAFYYPPRLTACILGRRPHDCFIHI
nr:MAG TPA: hypothetical protein [Caudoviricetes sp.]